MKGWSSGRKEKLVCSKALPQKFCSFLIPITLSAKLSFFPNLSLNNKIGQFCIHKGKIMVKVCTRKKLKSKSPLRTRGLHKGEK